MNESFGAYQVILNIVNRQNHHVSVFNSKSIALNQSVFELHRQFHYPLLSLLDTEKKCVHIDAYLNGTYIPINKRRLYSNAVGISIVGTHEPWKEHNVTADFKRFWGSPCRYMIRNSRVLISVPTDY